MQPGLVLAAKQVIRECRVAELTSRVGRLMEQLDTSDVDDVMHALAGPA
jgi:hypothetical protein